MVEEAMVDEGPAVFVVDDDPSVRDGLGRLVRSIGLNVQVFASARELLAATRPDAKGCIILDMQLPDLNGLELQEALTRARLALPIIFLTAHGDIPTSVRAMK